MVICHCLRINDRVISRLSEDPTVTADDITRACGAGGQCGACRPTIDAILEKARAEHAAPAAAGTPVAVRRWRRLVSAA